MRFTLTQRTSVLSIMLLLVVGAMVIAGSIWFQGSNLQFASIVFGISLFYMVLAYVYWRGWEFARYLLLASVVLHVGALIPLNSTGPSLIVALTPAIAAIIGGGWTIGVSAVATYLLLIMRSGISGPYVTPIALTGFVLIVGAIICARLITDMALRAAQQNAAEAEAERARVSVQAAEIERARQAAEAEVARQQELLALVDTLETPAIPLTDTILCAPLVGRLDSARLARVQARLLDIVQQRRTRTLVIDLAGVVGVDAEVAQNVLKLAHAVRLLGCQVLLSGIPAETALVLSSQALDMRAVGVVRSPQDVLASNALVLHSTTPV